MNTDWDTWLHWCILALQREQLRGADTEPLPGKELEVERIEDELDKIWCGKHTLPREALNDIAILINKWEDTLRGNDDA